MGRDPVIGDGRVRNVLIEDRVIALCTAHADEFLATSQETIADLRTHFTESGGQRSLVPRRAELNRRLFPPRPEGRRLGAGRREGEQAQ